MYSVVSIVNSIVSHIWKFVRVELKSSHHKWKIMWGNWFCYYYCGSHFPTCTNFKSLSVQSLSRVQLFFPACHHSLYITSSWSLLKLMSNESVMPSNHLKLCRPLLLLLSIFPSCWLKKNAQPEIWELSFIWGRMRTAAWEIIPQIALRNCSKELWKKDSMYMILVNRCLCQVPSVVSDSLWP